MPTRHCSLCASDEGLFLRITSKNRNTLLKQLEACSLIKTAKKSNCLSSGQICHKCAYEVKLCDTFLEKVRWCHSQEKQPPKSNCILCHESLPRAYVFNLNEDKNVENFKEILDDLADKLRDKGGLVCLTCRYTLDILVDLKSIYQNTINKLGDKSSVDIDYSTFPKVKTSVVSRKTTVRDPENLTVYVISDSDSECSDTMARGKSRHNKVTKQKKSPRKKLRICEGCHAPVKDGSDMYKFHRTGLIVCRACWTNMDSGLTGTRKQKKSTETKSCTVFLKDVLTGTTSKENKLYRVEEDSRGNKVYIITDDSSEGESKPERRHPGKRKATSDTENEKVLKRNAVAAAREKSDKSTDKKRKVEETIEETNIRTRQADKKRKVDAKSSDPPKEPETQPQPQQQQQNNIRTLRRTAKDNTGSEETTSKTSKPKLPRKPLLRELDEKSVILRSTLRKRPSRGRPKKLEPRKPIAKTKAKRAQSDLDIADRADRKKLKGILRGIKPSRTDASDESSSDGEDSVKGQTKSTKTLRTNPEQEENTINEDQQADLGHDNNEVEDPVAESADLSDATPEKEAPKASKSREAKSRTSSSEEPPVATPEKEAPKASKSRGAKSRRSNSEEPPDATLEKEAPKVSKSEGAKSRTSSSEEPPDATPEKEAPKASKSRRAKSRRLSSEEPPDATQEKESPKTAKSRETKSRTSSSEEPPDATPEKESPKASTSREAKSRRSNSEEPPDATLEKEAPKPSKSEGAKSGTSSSEEPPDATPEKEAPKASKSRGAKSRRLSSEEPPDATSEKEAPKASKSRGAKSMRASSEEPPDATLEKEAPRASRSKVAKSGRLRSEEPSDATPEKEAPKASKSGRGKSRRASGEEPAFVCTECGVPYQNKLIGMTHRLTHFKQPEIRLEKILPVGGGTSESASTEAAPRERINEQAEDQADSILITVDDDEDDTDVEKNSNELEEAHSPTNGPVDAEIGESPTRNSADTRSPASSVTKGRKRTVTEEAEDVTVIDSVDQPASSRPAAKSELEQDESSSTVVPAGSSPTTKREANQLDAVDLDSDDDLDKQKTNKPEKTERCDKANANEDDVIVEEVKEDGAGEPGVGSNENDEKSGTDREKGKARVADEDEDVEEVELLADSPKESSDQNTRLEECDEEVEEEEADIEIRMDEKDVDITMTTVQNGRKSSKGADSGSEVEEWNEEEGGSTKTEKQEKEEKEVNGKTASARKEGKEQQQPDEHQGQEEEEEKEEEEGAEKTIKEKEDTECTNDDTGPLDSGSSPSKSVEQEGSSANDGDAGAKETESAQTDGGEAEEEQEKVGEKGGEGGATASTADVEQLTDHSGAATGEATKSARGCTEAIVEGLEENEPGRINETDAKSSSESGDAAAAEVMQEVFELATAELRKRENAAESTVGKEGGAAEAETLENISREIQNSADA